MACSTFLQSMAQATDPPHLERDSRCYPSSTTTTTAGSYAPTTLTPYLIEEYWFSSPTMREMITEQLQHDSHLCLNNHATTSNSPILTDSPARLSSSGRSSPSEFEFSMSSSTLGPHSSGHSPHMLSADQLFHEGKLLPLYNSQPDPTPLATAQICDPVDESITANTELTAANENSVLKSCSSSCYNASSAQQFRVEQHPLSSSSSCSSSSSSSSCYSASTAQQFRMEQRPSSSSSSSCSSSTSSSSSNASSAHQFRVEQHPLSPKAPTCTSRWKELFGLKRGPDGPNCKVQCRAPQQGKSGYELQPLAPRRSTDAVSESLKSSISSQDESQEQESNLPLPSFYDALSDPSTRNAQGWQMDRPMSGSRSSRSSDDSSEGAAMEARLSSTAHNGSIASAGGAVRRRSSTLSNSRARSPTRHQQQQLLHHHNWQGPMSPRRGGAGGNAPSSRGVSPGRPSTGSRPTESSRSAIATRLVVRGLDRSYSSPKPMRKRPDQVRGNGRQRASNGSLERSTSYSAGVRVSPVINVPVYMTPALRKGSKGGIFSLSQLFSSKKDKYTSKQQASNHHIHVEG